MSNPTFKTNAPFGLVDAQNVAYGSTIAATIAEQETHLTIAQMTGASTLNLTVGSEVKAGAKLVIMVSADGTGRALTLGTGLTGNAITVTANKTFVIVAERIGSSFVVTSSLVTN